MNVVFEDNFQKLIIDTALNCFCIAVKITSVSY